MKRTKRAFTIVELVIVIAVVAVLAAVLIPTFVSLVNRANESSDIQAVKNMNTALMADETANGTPASASEAILAVQDAGLNPQTYNALVSGRAIYYNKGINRMVYVQLDEDGFISSVLFPEEYASYNQEENTDFWNSFYLLTGRQIADKGWLLNPETQNSKTELDNLKNNTSTDNDLETNTSYYENGKLVGAAVVDHNGMLGVAEYIEGLEDNGAGFTLVLGSDVYMTDDGKKDGVIQEWKPISMFAGDFYGRDNTIFNLQIKDATADSLQFAAETDNANYAYYGFISVFTGSHFGNVTFTNVQIDEPGNGVRRATGYNSDNHTVGGAIGAIYATGGDSSNTPHKVTIENVTVGSESGDTSKIIGVNRVAGIVGFIGGYSSNTDGTSKFPKNSTVTITGCKNYADIISVNRSNKTHATAGGIVSTSNQTGKNVNITIENCENHGDISGMWVGGIMADAWRSNDKGGSNDSYDPGNIGLITIDSCTNSGDLTGVCPPDIGDTVVVGGIYGAFNGFRFSDVTKERFELKITGCSNSGTITYQWNDNFKANGSIYLADIVSCVRVHNSQKGKGSVINDPGAAITSGTNALSTLITGYLTVSGTKTAMNSSNFILTGTGAFTNATAPSTAGQYSVFVKDGYKLYIDYLGTEGYTSDKPEATT